MLWCLLFFNAVYLEAFESLFFLFKNFTKSLHKIGFSILEAWEKFAKVVFWKILDERSIVVEGKSYFTCFKQQSFVLFVELNKITLCTNNLLFKIFGEFLDVADRMAVMRAVGKNVAFVADFAE